MLTQSMIVYGEVEGDARVNRALHSTRAGQVCVMAVRVVALPAALPLRPTRHS
jgi:hypothetical protein